MQGFRASRLRQIKDGSGPRWWHAERVSKTRILNAKERAAIDRIGAEIAKRGITWPALSERIGKSKQLGYQWSTYRSFPSQPTFRLIGEELGVEMGWLLSGDDEDERRKAQSQHELAALEMMRGAPAESYPGLLEVMKAYLAGANAAVARIKRK